MMAKKSQGEHVTGSVVVGIDQSYNGFAVTVLGESGYWTGLWVLPGEGVSRLVAAQQIVREVLDDWADEHYVRDVGLEGYSHGAKNGAHLMGELGAAVKLEIFRHPVGPKYATVVTPSEVKKAAIGKGTASKDLVLLGVYKTWGIEFDDNNMADSYAIARVLSKEGA